MKTQAEERKKKHHAKSRLGCLSCKRRRLKCDETRPACQRCVKDFGICEGYDPPRAWVFEPIVDHAAPAIGCVSTVSPSSSSSATSSSRKDSSDGSSQSSTSPASADSSTATSELDHTRQKRWAPKSKRGCATCKKRRVKCDEGRPSCSRCLTSERVCEYTGSPEETYSTTKNPLQLLHRKNGPMGNADHASSIVHVNNTPYKTQAEYQTFVHWQGRTESCMVISRSFGNFNILGGALPQAAWSYDCLKHALLSAASVTASIEQFSLGEFNERQAVVEAVRQSNLAISTIFDEKPPPEVTVLVAFVFWFMEAWIGAWGRAVMHLASAARMCEQGFAKGEVSEAVAWYVGICDAGVPQALRNVEILRLCPTREDDPDDKFHVRLLWGIREAVAGIALLKRLRIRARQVRPNDCDQFDAILGTHQAQMRFMSDRWRQHAKLQLVGDLPTQQVPPPPAIPTYSKIHELANYFFNNDERYDSLVLAVYLKMIQRSLPLFIAGKNIEIRRDAALSIPIKIESIEPELLLLEEDNEPVPVETRWRQDLAWHNLRD